VSTELAAATVPLIVNLDLTDSELRTSRDGTKFYVAHQNIEFINHSSYDGYKFECLDPAIPLTTSLSKKL
jgi:hypothetical protein